MNGQINEKQSLVGRTMPSNGKSAYEYAKDGGFVGTEQEFAEKLATEYAEASTTSQVLSENANAFGTNNVVGCKGYYFGSIDLTNKKIYLSKTKITPTISTTDNTDKSFETPAYAVGDYFNIINDKKYVYCGTIKAISNNVVTYEGDLGFTAIATDTGVDGHTFCVPSKSEVGTVLIAGAQGFAINRNNHVAGKDGFAGGLNNVVASNYGVCFGSGNMAGYVGFSIGGNNKSKGDYSVTDGGWNEANAQFSGSHGYQNKSNADFARTFGVRNVNEGVYGFIAGLENRIKGGADSSFVGGGYNNEAQGIYGSIGGAHNIIHKSSVAGRVHGVANEVKGYGGSADGYKNISNGFAQSVRGVLNIEDTEEKYLDIVGNGNSANNERSNAYTLDRQGNAWYAGKVITENIELFNSYEETDKYYFEGEEEQLILSEYGVTLPFEGITSAYKLNAEITKEQLANITGVRLVSLENWDMFKFDLTESLAENAYGSIYSLGDLGIVIVGFDTGIIPLTLSETVSINVPIPSKGIFMAIPDENYNMLANNCVLEIIGGTITAKKYTQIDDRYLPIPHPIEQNIRKENGGLKAPDFSKEEPNNVQDGGFVVGRDNTGGKYSFVVGSHNKAGYNSSVTGMNNDVTVGEHCTVGGVWHYVQHPYCTVFGVGNKVYAQKTFVVGEGNVANAIQQSVMGRFNVPIENCVLIVGNGTSDTARSNAHTIDWDGNGWFAGNIEAQAIILKSTNGKKFKITVDNDGNLKVVNQNSGGLV